VSGLLPSKVTGDYWVYADSPAATEADGARTGKWLVFVPARQVDQWWGLIRLATEQGLLGTSAKAATARPNELATSQRTKLICVYTRDWQDHGDVRRVLPQLRNLGVTARLSYKTDEATASGVYGTCREPGTTRRLGARCPGRSLDGHRSWYLSLELPPGLDGQRRRGGFPTRAVAEVALARLAMPPPGDPARPPLTVGQWLERWLVNRVVPRPSTLQEYAAHVRLYLAPYLGQILLADLAPAHVQAMFTAISRQHEAMVCRFRTRYMARDLRFGGMGGLRHDRGSCLSVCCT